MGVFVEHAAVDDDVSETDHLLGKIGRGLGYVELAKLIAGEGLLSVEAGIDLLTGQGPFVLMADGEFVG